MSTETYRPIKVHIVIQIQRDDFFFKKRHVREPHAKGSVQFFFIKTDRYSSAYRAQPTHSLA